MMSPSTNRIYFPGFNGLRLIAALAVVVHHVEQFKYSIKLPHAFASPVIWSFGGQGVALFFVLSGFLITYLLLVELDRSGTISTRDFYVRRVLRIFPLYYLILFFALFVAPFAMSGMGGHVGAYQDLFFQAMRGHLAELVLINSFWLPNLGLLVYPPVLFATQIWSIGTEEQFYLIWPWLFRFARERLLPAMFAVIALKVGLTWGISLAGDEGRLSPEFVSLALQFSTLFRLEFMAIGGIAAFVLFRHPTTVARTLRFPSIDRVSLLLLVVLLGAGAYVPHWMLATGYAWLILNIASSGRRGRGLDRPALNHLGKLSYGIYMFHPLMILLTLSVVEKSLGFGGFGWGRHALVLGVSILSTIALAELSYRSFEGFFLRRKDRFTRVASMSSELGREDPRNTHESG